ncbi:MAG: Uma2 family endonuclease [Cyanobacteriota bacterium]|nr:Uma2 family endonuclease [Cyanobacteriota bacterium]
MTLAQTPEQLTPFSTLEPENVTLPPCNLESDEPPLESDLHRDQIDLLLACLKWWWRDRDDFYATGNLTIYYNSDKITTRDFRGPDFFVVRGVENRPRRSWMVWAEKGKYPNIIIEFLSNSTAKVDRTTKKDLYQDTFRTPEYFWFHPETLEFKGFRLMGGEYEQLKVNSQGWLWSEQLELFVGISESKLRFFDAGGRLILSPDERAVQAEQQVEQLRSRLRELGIDP